LNDANDSVTGENGALMIFWISSALSAANFTPSKTLACFTEVKSLIISGRLSRVVRAASAVLLESGMSRRFSAPQAR